jgi:hypothetical protein
MHRKLLKYIQDSDVAITILLFAIAGLSFRGVPDNIWNDYLYIDWVFPLASSYILFIIATIFLIKSMRKILLKNIDNDLKISKEEIPSIINVFVYSVILFFYLVCLFAFGFWPASLLLLWVGILYFRPEKNLNSIMKSLGIALITCLIAYIVFSSVWLFYVPFPKSRIWI